MIHHNNHNVRLIEQHVNQTVFRKQVSQKNVDHTVIIANMIITLIYFMLMRNPLQILGQGTSLIHRNAENTAVR